MTSSSLTNENLTSAYLNDSRLLSQNASFFVNGSKFISENESFFLKGYNPLYIYGGLVFGSAILLTARNVLMYFICKRSSSNIHNMMLSCILKTPMRFFDENPSGKHDFINFPLLRPLISSNIKILGIILNRFTKDLGSVDEILSLAFVESLQVLSILIGIMVQVLIINWWLLLPMSVMVFLQMKINSAYLKTTRSIKRLEGNGKYPKSLLLCYLILINFIVNQPKVRY